MSSQKFSSENKSMVVFCADYKKTGKRKTTSNDYFEQDHKHRTEVKQIMKTLQHSASDVEMSNNDATNEMENVFAFCPVEIVRMIVMLLLIDDIVRLEMVDKFFYEFVQFILVKVRATKKPFQILIDGIYTTIDYRENVYILYTVEYNDVLTIFCNDRNFIPNPFWFYKIATHRTSFSLTEHLIYVNEIKSRGTIDNYKSLHKEEQLYLEDLIVIASEYTDLKTVQLLVENGADVNIWFQQPVIRAIVGGNLFIVQFLVSKGAPVTNIQIQYNSFYSDLSSEVLSETQTYYYYDPIVVAASYGHTDIISFLIENGANVQANKSAAVVWASRGGYTQIVHTLRKLGADIRTNNDDALFYAAWCGHHDTVRYLLRCGASLSRVEKLYAAYKKYNVSNGFGLRRGYAHEFNWEVDHDENDPYAVGRYKAGDDCEFIILKFYGRTIDSNGDRIYDPRVSQCGGICYENEDLDQPFYVY